MIDWIKKLRTMNMSSVLDMIAQSGVESVSWLEFLKQSGVILKDSRDPRAQTKLKLEILQHLPPLWRNEEAGQVLDKTQWAKFSPEVCGFWGEQILELFFRSLVQWRQSNLDFRSNRFLVSSQIEKPIGVWSLSRYFVHFDPEFSKRMSVLLQGYFENRPRDLKAALIELGLLSTEQESEEIEKILSGLLRERNDRPATFSSRAFKESALALFNYSRKHRKKIPANFVWFTIALGGLYECLETLGQSYRVRECYRRAIDS